MIKTRILENFFFVWSVLAETAATLAPSGLRPVIFEERGWLSVAVVRFRNVKLFGLPVAGEALAASLMLVVDYADARGILRRGNYFLDGFTDSLGLVFGDRLFGLRVFRRADIVLERGTNSLKADIAGLMKAEMDLKRPLAAADQARFDRLFEGNHSGVVGRGGGLLYSPLEKSHWTMKGHPAEAAAGRRLQDMKARYEFAGDTSDSVGTWNGFRRIR